MVGALLAPATTGHAQDSTGAPPLAQFDVVFEAGPPTGWPTAPFGTARSILAVEASTGQVLAERNADERFEVASTVKLVTALAARRLYRLNDVLVAGPESRIEGSTAGVDPGERWTVRQLLTGLLVRSGNDAAEVLAAGGGDRESFIAQMQAVVEDLDVRGATVLEPSGLEDANLLSARDLATIARAVLEDPVLAGIVGARSADLPGIGVVPNRNLLLERLDNAVGVKTGTTDIAGSSLVGAATWQGSTVITVVLGAVADEPRYDESEALQRWVDRRLTAQRVRTGGRIRIPGAWLGRRRALAIWAPGQVEVTTSLSLQTLVVTSRIRGASGPIAQAVVSPTSQPAPAGAGRAAAATVYESLRAAQTVGLLDGG